MARSIDGVRGLRAFVLSHRDSYAQTFTAKLLTYALGRLRRLPRQAGHPKDRSRSRRHRLPLVVYHPGYRPEHAVSVCERRGAAARHQLGDGSR